MAETSGAPPVKRSYGCIMGCGRPYDFILIAVQGDNNAQFLCFPHFLETARDVLLAITEPEDPKVQAAIAAYEPEEDLPMDGRQPRYGHEAPTNIQDEDFIDSYDGIIDEDEIDDAAP